MTRHAVELPHADYAVDRKAQKLFLLTKNRLQLQEFHATTGKFVQTIETDQGTISKVRVVNSRLYVVYERIVTSVQGDQKPTKVSKEFKKGEKLIDTNGFFVLVQKADRYCIEELTTKASKTSKDEERKCIQDTHEYLYPSGQGFWFLDRRQDKLVHVSTKEISAITIAAKEYEVVTFRGVTNNLAVREAGTTQLYVLKDTGIARGDTIEKTCTADSNVLFSADANPVYWGLTCFRTGKIQGELNIEAVEVAGGKVKQSVSANTISTHGPIGKIWICNSIGKSHPVLVAYKDGQYTQYNERGNQQWTRVPELENSLDVLAADFPSEDQSEEIPVYESFGNNLVGAFMYRIYSDIKSLTHLASTILPKLSNINVQALINKITGKQSNEIGDLNYYNKYGLRKTLVFVTRQNKLVAVDSLNGQSLWTLTLKPNQAIEKATLDADNNIELVYLENGNKKRTVVRSLDGSFMAKETPVDGSATVFLQDTDGKSILEAGFKANHLKNAKTDFSFYRVVKDQGIFGYRWNAGVQRFEETWNYVLEPGQEIVEYSYHLKGTSDYLTRAATGSLSALPEDEALYYKIVDSGNVALLIKQTVNTKDLMTVVIVNTVRGKVLTSLVNDVADFSLPVGFVFDDNGVYVSYMNSRLGSFELWSIELLATRVETSFMEMIQTFVLRLKRREELDYHADKPQFIVLDQKYGLPFGLKYLGAVSTRHGLTKRNLIGITTTNDVISIDRMLVSPRRNTIEGIEKAKNSKKGAVNYYSQVYPPYQYFLPISPLATLNAKWRLGSIDKIKIVETKFESTSLLIAYGKDVFVTKIQPDLTFDLLNEEFNYELLGLACIVITVLVVVLRRLGKGSEAKKRYLGA